MARYKAILFDFDGTTLDTHALVYEAYKHTFKKNFNREISDNELGAMMGKTLVESYRLLTGRDDVSDFIQDHQDFQVANIHLGVPFKRTKKTLRRIKKSGIKTALVTSRHLLTLEKSLAEAGLLNLFDVVIHADSVSNHKPHPESLEMALRALEVSPEDAVMVGDTDADILVGKSAGVKTVGVTYGFYGMKIKDYNPDFLINDISEILSLLES